MPKKIDFRLWAGFAVSIFFLVLFFRKVDLRQIALAMSSVDPLYLIAAIGFTFASYFGRAIRWKYLLLPLKTCGMGNLFRSTLIGYMANNLLPARIGEFIRAFVLADREKLPKASVFATLVVDRLLDGFSVLIILLGTLFFLVLPEGSGIGHSTMKTAGVLTLCAYLVVVAVLILLRVRTEAALRVLHAVFGFAPRLRDRLLSVAASFVKGIDLPRQGSALFQIIVWSGLIWLFALIPIDLVLRSFGVILPFSASMFIMVLLVFAVMVPASPGYVGTYHYACLKALTVFGLAEDKAAGIAIIIHGIGFLPVIIAGMVSMWKSGISLKALRGDAV